jgi:hypothetical protein
MFLWEGRAFRMMAESVGRWAYWSSVWAETDECMTDRTTGRTRTLVHEFHEATVVWMLSTLSWICWTFLRTASPLAGDLSCCFMP